MELTREERKKSEVSTRSQLFKEKTHTQRVATFAKRNLSLTFLRKGTRFVGFGWEDEEEEQCWFSIGLVQFSTGLIHLFAHPCIIPANTGEEGERGKRTDVIKNAQPASVGGGVQQSKAIVSYTNYPTE